MFPTKPGLGIILLLVTLLLAACGTAAPPVRSVALPQGWQAVKQAGLAFGLPQGWEVLAADDQNFASALDELVQSNPRLKSVADQTRKALSGGQIKIMAFDLAPEDALPNFTTNLSIGLQQMDRATSLAEVAGANEAQLRATGFTEIERTTARIGGEIVARLSSTMQITDAAGQALPLAFEQYIFLRDQKQYVLTFTTASDQRQKLQPTFDQIARTFQPE